MSVVKHSTADNKLFELLALKKRKIEFIDYFFFSRKQTDSLRHVTQIYNEINDDISDIINDVGFDLIYLGKFMIYGLADNHFIKKGLKVKKKSVDWNACFLPNGNYFRIRSKGALVE